MAASRPVTRSLARAIRAIFSPIALATAALLLWQGEARATHAMGGELTYACLGNNQYKVTLKFYRDCNGVAAPTNCNNGLEFNVRSANCNANFNQCFTLENVQVITPICPTELDRCLNANGTYGVEQYTFSRIINLSQWANCGTGNDWVISWALCCRNNAITSLQNPGNQSLYLNTNLNTTVNPCNNSPVFTTLPTPYYCVGQPISYNPGATDADGDSLAYSIIQPRTTNNQPINFAANYSLAQPIRNGGGAGAVQLDPITGTLTCIPSIQQVAVVTYRVREFRNGVEIGAVTRDVQFVVRACTGNTAPTASGINGTGSFNLTVCAGTPVSFTINSSDPNNGQTTTLVWNNGIPGATFTTSGSPFQSATFSWTPTLANLGNNTFAVTVSDNACPLVGTNQVGYTVTVVPPLTPADAGPDLEACGPIALQGVQPFTSVPGTWSVVSGSGTFSNVNDPNATVSGMAVGTNVFQWTLNYAPCGITNDQVTVVNYSPTQAAANAGPDQQLCAPFTTTTLAGNTAAAPAVGTWTVVQGTGTFTNANQPNTQVSGLSPGINRFRWSIDNGPCAAITQDEVVVTVFTPGATANAGPDQAICTPGSGVTMNATSAPAPATGTWTLVSGTGTITNANSATTQITGLPVGTHVFQWTVNNGACGTSNDQVTVQVFDASSPNANAGPDQQVCATSATLAGNTPIAPALGAWTLVSGSGTITNPASPTSTVTGLGIGANVFQWTVNNGPCANGITTDQVTITRFDPNQPVANAGPDQSACTPFTTATMAGSAVTFPATGTWTLVSGSGTITNPGSPTTTITNLGIGTNVFQWTVNNGPCGAPTTDQVAVTIFDQNAQAAAAGPDQSVCSTNPVVTVTGNAPVGAATGTWSIVSGTGTITSPNSTTTTVTGLGVGTVVIRWTINNGSCGSSSDDLTVQVFSSANPVANAGPDQQFCAPTSSTTLAGSNLIAPATGQWTVVSGSGVFANAGSPTSGVTGMAVGVNTFRWTVNNGACANPVTQDEVSILVFDANNLPANAGPDQVKCRPDTTAIMAGSALIIPATGTWSLLSGSGTIVSPNSPTTLITGLGIGDNVFRWVVNNGPCGPTTFDDVLIKVFDDRQDVAIAGPDQSICIPTFPNTVTLNGTPLIYPATGTWTLVSGTGTITSPNAATTTVTGLDVGVNVFQWTINNGPCANPITSDQVTVFVYDAANPAANAGPDQGLCTPINSTVLAGNVPTVPASGTWTLVSGSGTIVDPSDPSSQVTGLGLGNNVFQWTVNNGPCVPGTTSDQVTINVFNGAGQPADAGPDQEVCSDQGGTTLAGNAPTGLATGFWTVQQGTATFADPTVFNTTVTGLSVGATILVWNIDNGACGISSDPMTILVFDAQQGVANAGPDQSICDNGGGVTVTLDGSATIFPGGGEWVVISGTANITSPNSPVTTVTGLSPGETVLQWQVSNGPCSPGFTTDDVSIFIYDGNENPAFAGADQELCTPQTSTLLNGSSVNFPATGQWTVVQGTGVFADDTDPNTTVSGLSVGVNILRWTENNGPCANPITSDDVVITVFDENNPVADAGPDQEVCTPLTSATLASSSLIFPATGQWTVVSGTGTFVDATDPNTVVNGLSLGANVFQWTVSNGPCANGITTDQVTITLFDASTPAADAGPDQELCGEGALAEMAASPVIAPGVGTWTLVAGEAVIVDANDPTTAIQALGIGENIFVWTVDNGSCGAGLSTDTVSIFVFDANNPVADAGPDQELCTPDTDAQLAGSTYAFPAAGTWSVIQGTGVFADPNDPNTTVTGLSVGENIFQWTVTNGPCANPLTTDQVSIFVFDANNPVADAGPDQELCLPAVTTSLQGSAVIFPAQGTWTLVSGQGTITDPNDPNSTVTDLGVGANVFAWTVSNGPCANGITSDTLTILLFDDQNPGANAGPDQELCTPASSTTLQGSPVTFPAVGTWTVISGTANIADVNDPNTAVSGLVIGEVVLQWSVSNGPCGTPTTDQVSIFLFDENNPVADAGPDQELCTPQDATTMAGSSVTFPAQGTWTLVSGSGTVVNANDPNSAVIGLAVGENVFAWTVDNGPCANGTTTDQVSIFVFDAANPVAAAGADQELCTPTTNTQLSASAVIFPAIGTWTSSDPNVVFADANDPNTTVSNLQVGSTTLTWTVDNGPCESGISDDDLTILLYDDNNAVADAGPDQELCTPNTSTNMAGSAVTFPAQGTWTLVTGQGTIADPNDPNTAIADLAIGENVFLWTVTNGPCTNPLTTDLVSIFVFDENNPVANAGNDQQVCTPVTSATLAGSTVTFPATGTWTLTSGQGTITDPADPNTTVTDLGIGVNEFTWTVSNGPCANGLTSDAVNITLFDLNAPPAEAGPDQEFCTPTSTAVMGANDPTPPGFGAWSVAQGTANFADAASPNTAVSGLTVGENILVWTLDNGVCGVSTDSVSVFIFDENNPPADAGPDVEICTPQDSIFLAGNTPIFPATGTWTLIDGAGTFEDVNDPNSKVVGLAIGANTFVWTTDNGPCANAITSDTMTVILYSDSTNAPNAGPDLETCLPLTFAQLQAETPLAPATGSWTLIGGTGTIVDPTNPTTLVNDLTVGISTFVWTLDLGPCPNNGLLTDTMQVYVYDPTAPNADAGPDQELCTPDDSTTMQALTPTFPGEGTWTLVSGTGVVSDIHDPNATVTGLTIGLNAFEWLVYNGQCGQGPPTRDTVVIAVFDSTAAPAAAGPDQAFCTPNTSTTLAGNAATFPGTGAWTVVQGGATIADPADPVSAVTDIAVGTNVLVWTIDNGACGTTSDTLVIDMYDGDAPDADAGPDQEICVPTQPNTVLMAANAPVAPATGLWTLVSGSGTIVDPTSTNTEITDLEVGVHVFQWTIDNGPCGSTNDVVTITVYDAASPNANAGPDQEICTPTSSVALAGNTPTPPATGTWTIVSGSGTLSDPAVPGAILSGLSAGVTVLVWTLDNGPCANGITTDTMTVTVYNGSLATADAGEDDAICAQAPASYGLTGVAVAAPASGTWSLVSGDATITDPTSATSTITDVGYGPNVLLWTVDNGVCGTTSDEVTISVFDPSEGPANAGPDQLFCQDTTTATMHAVPLTSATATGLWTLFDGAGVIDEPTDTNTTVSELALGDNIFVWTVSNGPCGTTTDTVLITLRDCSRLVIPDAFSPNGDGVNDTYVIEGLIYYPLNKFQVFNRWGSQVLERSPYNNDWDGRSEADMNWGELLPESTYYYILDLGNGDAPYTGYIYLKR
ncbi:MAG: gliding motility-associated C-terminal domain-containing protein [Flavobacteriales bacterium]